MRDYLFSGSNPTVSNIIDQECARMNVTREQVVKKYAPNTNLPQSVLEARASIIRRAKANGKRVCVIARAIGRGRHIVRDWLRAFDCKNYRVIPALISDTQMNYSLHSKCADNS